MGNDGSFKKRLSAKGS